MNIAILEDESIHIYRLTEIISSLLKDLGVSSYDLKTFKDKKALLAELFIPSNQNIYFLDLELQGDQQQGLKVGQQIRDYDSQAALIFFTSHAELMPLTYKYKVAALDFIAKDSPTILDSIKEDFKLVLNKRQKNTSEMFSLHVGNHFIDLEFAKICFFETHYSNSHASILWLTDNRKLQIAKNLHELEQLEPRLSRVHRSFLVNLANVEVVDNSQKLLFFKNGLSCPISRRKLKLLQTKNKGSY